MQFPFFRRNQPELARKDSAAYALQFQNLEQAEWSPRNYGAFSKEGYIANVVAYQAIRRIATAIATLEWIAVDESGKDIPDHPVLSVIDNPNPAQTRREWLEAKISYLYLGGNSYDERVMRGGRLLELWTLRPDRFSIKLGKTGLAREYIYQQNGRKTVWRANPTTGDSDIYHAKLFNPTDDLYGLSPFNAGAYAIDVHNMSMSWMNALLQNSAAPSGALVMKADSNALSDTEYDRLKKEIELNYSGAKNAGRPMLLEGGLDWKAMGLSPQDMTLVESKDSVARDISLAFGIPPLLLNIPGDNTYSNYGEARRGFYEDTVIPLAFFVADAWNKWLKTALNGAKIRPDLDKIDAIAQKRRDLWDMVNQAPDLTVDEARKLRGLPPLGGEIGQTLMVHLKNANQTQPTPEGTEDV